MKTIILDCYTDEPAGLGVPPYLGTYPRYIAGFLKQKNIEPIYMTIDDIRLFKKYNSIIPETKEHQKTDISIHNLTKNYKDIKKILNNSDEIIIIIGVHTPGTYLSATPGTISEIKKLLEGIRAKKVLTGPAIYGTQLHGGRFTEKIDDPFFDEIREYDYSYPNIQKTSIIGTSIMEYIPETRIIEIETSSGCTRKKGCSFCLEPIKNHFQIRPKKDIISEIKAFHKIGERHFRLGKQSCIYSYPDIIPLLKEIREIGEIKTLHIDNVNPANVLKDKKHEITKAIVEYCTPGNIAAFGVESFDHKVIDANNLNSDKKTTIEAVKIINKYGAERGENGMPKFLPGINILLGLEKENKSTLTENFESLKYFLDNNLLLRRINIRKVIPFEGTNLHTSSGNKYLRKNNKHYFSFRKKVREEIDHIMLQKLVPKGTILKYVIPEIYDGKTTFCRQIGTYPLIIGVKERLTLKEPISLEVTGYMLRSIIGKRI
jgi:radical SAM superfamily enzyme with C-terminal helix-hairpin-helix motif